MGLLLAGLSGLGQGIAAVGADRAHMMDEQDIISARAAAEEAMHERLLDYQLQAQADQRHANMDEIQANVAKQKQADTDAMQKLVDQYATSGDNAATDDDGNPVDLSKLSLADAANHIQIDNPEDAAIVKNFLRSDRDRMLDAGIATGLTPINDINRQEIAQMRMEAMMANANARLEAMKDRSQTMLEIAKMRNELGAAGGSHLPAPAMMIDYMVKNGIIDNTPEAKKQALTELQKGKTKDDVALQASVFNSLSQNNFGSGKLTPAQLWKQAGDMVSGSRALAAPDAGDSSDPLGLFNKE